MNRFKILNNVNSPKDLKNLSLNDLEKLSEELSLFIHEVISEIGGHYSSPLGVIDLTIALHFVYRMPMDKIIWDVGHQAYAHKVITGRKEEFKTIRKLKSISGFLKINESDYGGGIVDIEENSPTLRDNIIKYDLISSPYNNNYYGNLIDCAGGTSPRLIGNNFILKLLKLSRDHVLSVIFYSTKFITLALVI